MDVRVNLAEALLSARAERGSQPALHEPRRSWTYDELADTVARLGGALTSLGVQRGDRVAVLMPDGLEAAASILGAVWIGAIAVPLSEFHRAKDVRALVRDAAPTVVIVHASLEPVLEEVRADLESVREVVVAGATLETERSFDGLVVSSRPVPPADTKGTDPALILYSTGPSDHPRGVAHTHAAPLAAARAVARDVLQLSSTDRAFSLARLATAYGLCSGLVFPLHVGAQSILLPEQAKSRPVFAMMEGMRPTVLFATSSLFSQLLVDLEVDPAGAPPLGGALRACVAGGEVLPGDLAERVRARLGVEVLCGYGLTEALSFVIATPPGRARPGSAGLVVPGWEARIVGEDGSPVGTHEIGTLEISTPSLAQGYWGRPDEFAALVHDGWFRTADRFLVDADGYHYHCGRTDDMFKVGGRWVSPAEVERTLLAHEAVWECAVIGVDDDDGLTKTLAYVVPNLNHTASPELERQLIEFVKNEIAPYKYPRWIEFVDALPKGPQGKVLRYKLTGRRPRRRAATTTG